MLVHGLKYCEDYQDLTQAHKVRNAVGKMVLIGLLNARLPQTFSLKKNSNNICEAQLSEV